MNGLKPPKQRVMPSMGSYKPRHAVLNCAIPRRFLIRWRVLSIRCQMAASSCRGDTASCNCSSIAGAFISTWHSVLLITPWWLCENLCSQVSLQSCGGRLNALPSKSVLLRWYLDRLACQGHATGPASTTSATTWSCGFALHVVNERQSL